MKLMSFERPGDAGRQRYGVAVANGVVDVTDRLPFASLIELIASNGLDTARSAAEGAPVDYGFDEIGFLPPILRPEKIWCIGVNYIDRNEEYRDGTATPRYPSLFARAPRSLVGHGAPIERPAISEQLDYEGEIVLVVGRESKHLTKDDALDAVFGLTFCNEGTIRDWLHHGKFNVTQGKNFDRSGSVGPWIVTVDAVDPAQALTITTRVNGELRQSDSTNRMIFSFTDILVYLSSFATLSPGDLIVTGTPTGAGVRFDPPVWLRPGDNVEICVPEIGTLSNTIVAAGGRT